MMRERGAMATILLVEDDTAIREGLQEALLEEGYIVESARDGQDALSQLQQGLRPDVIVLDLMLPNISGQQFRVRQLADPDLRTIPLIVISAFPLADNIARALQATAFVPKPLQLNLLFDTIETLIR
jgi:CheY-like chemotaxis protein